MNIVSRNDVNAIDCLCMVVRLVTICQVSKYIKLTVYQYINVVTTTNIATHLRVYRSSAACRCKFVNMTASSMLSSTVFSEEVSMKFSNLSEVILPQT